jgi:NAD(P)-dependent dehydrogenase (short-subunit alcohol dehydrogenase family)
MAWTAADIPDQTGRVAIVTGGNGGLGLATVRALAGRGATVVMAARNAEKAAAALDDVRRDVADAEVWIQPLDLGSLASVRSAAAGIAERHAAVDLLFDNAGVMATPELTTDDGFELQLGTNHLGHFAFTALLFPTLVHSGGARVVCTTSTARWMGRTVDPDDPDLHGRYGPWKSYGRSKLANVHFALELQRRASAAGAPVASLLADPGLSNTELQTQSVHAPALPQLRAGTDPRAHGGELYAPRFVSTGDPIRFPLSFRSTDRKAGRRLWELSERLTGITFDVDELTRSA